MPIITISRQFGSAGAAIADLLCHDLKCNFIDKESLEEAFAQYGIPKESFERFDEKKPGLWDFFKADKTRYLHFLKGTILEEAQKGSCIVLGRGGQSLLADVTGVLHVRLIAPMDVRIERVKQRYECDEAHAEKIILRSDHERAGFHKFFFDRDWEDNELYDLIINTGSFPLEVAADTIINIIKTKEFKAARKEADRQLTNLSLEHRIKTAILYEEQIVIQFLEVTANNGNVVLGGIVTNSEDVAKCQKAAEAIVDVKEIRNDIYYKPISANYGMHY